MNLRDYQQSDLDELMFNIDFNDERKQILQGSVSYGKSALLAAICQEFNRKVFISLPFSDLVEQIEEILLKTDVDFSVIRSGQPSKFNRESRIQIALDSSYYAGINKRYAGLKTDLLIADEAHVRMEAKRFISMNNQLEPKNIIGLSGTPYKSNGTAFMDYIIVNNITHRGLIERGFVSEVETYVSNLYLKNGLKSKISVNDTDFSEEELSVMYTPESISTMIDKYEELCNLKGLEPKSTKTLWFATNVNACDSISEALSKRGYLALSYHGSTKFSEDIMDSYRNNNVLKKEVTLFNYKDIESVVVKHLVSVNKLTTGFSVDDIQVGVLTSGTARLNTHVQKAGRLSRKHGDMPKYLLDFGGSSVTFGDFQEHFVPLDCDAEPSRIREYISKRGIHKEEFLFKGNDLVISSQDIVDNNINKFFDDIKDMRLGDMRLGQLLDKWYLEDDNIMELVFIFLAFVKNAYCEPMTDKWGKDTVGYIYQKYDVDTGNTSSKEVSGFYNEKTAKWLTEIYFEAIEKYPEKKEHWIKAMKTKMFNMAKMRQFKALKDGVYTTEEFEEKYKPISDSIYALRFFPEFLLKKHLEELEDSMMNQQSTASCEIEIDESEIPF